MSVVIYKQIKWWNSYGSFTTLGKECRINKLAAEFDSKGWKYKISNLPV